MRRRGFLKAVLGGCAAAMIPIPVPAKAVPFSSIFKPGIWAEPSPDGQTVATLDGIFKRVYGNRIRTHMIPALQQRIAQNQKELCKPVFFQPITLKFENGFTEAR